MADVQFRLISDIHGEHLHSVFKLSEGADDKNTVLLLAGDIGVVKRPSTIKYLLEDASEIFDIDLSKLRRLRDSQSTLKQMFDFRLRTGEEGNPNHWQNYVMPDDDRAWHHVPKEDT